MKVSAMFFHYLTDLQATVMQQETHYGPNKGVKGEEECVLVNADLNNPDFKIIKKSFANVL